VAKRVGRPPVGNKIIESTDNIKNNNTIIKPKRAYNRKVIAQPTVDQNHEDAVISEHNEREKWNLMTKRDLITAAKDFNVKSNATKSMIIDILIKNNVPFP